MGNPLSRPLRQCPKQSLRYLHNSETLNPVSHAAINRAPAAAIDARAADVRVGNGSGILVQEPRGLVRAGGRPADVVAFEEALVDFFVEAAEILGVPKSVAAIYAICFASDQALSFSEINDRLEISSGSISQGLRILKEVGALKIAQPGRPTELSNNSLATAHELGGAALKRMLARSRERYEPNLELRKVATHFLEHRLARQLHSGHGRLMAVSKIIPTDTNGSAKIRRARLRTLRTWHDKARALLPIAKTFFTVT